MNELKKTPAWGDVVVKTKDGYRFISYDSDKEYIRKHNILGVVFYIEGNRVLLTVGNIGNYKWSEVCDFEITSIPTESGSLAVKLQNKDLGNFNYVKGDGSIEEFTSQLNTWLTSNAPKWESYYYNGKGILQLSDYDSSERTCTINGVTLVKKVGSELASEMESRNSNYVRQFTVYNGTCRERLEQYVKESTSKNSNPTWRINGTTQLFEVFPCSELYYNGKLGDGLRKNFATYQDYLDACMTMPFELDRGIMQFRSGKLNTERLIKKRLLKRGVEIYPYTAALKAYEYRSGIDSYNVNNYWLGSFHEVALLMKDITHGSSGEVDPVSISLKKCGLWNITIASYPWTSSCNSINRIWCLRNYGVADYIDSYYMFDVVPISEIYISNNSLDQINTLKSTPSYGDIFVSVNNKKKFISAYSDKSFIDQYADKAIGVVYDVNGKNFSVVAGVNNKSFPWSVACDFEITQIPEAGDLTVTLNSTNLGTFTYTGSTKQEFVTQLNSWLEINAPKWEAYMEDENTAILQMSTYNTYEGNCSITGCTLNKRVGLELADEASTYCRNQVFQKSLYNGCCRANLEKYVRNNISYNCNPAYRLNGITELFEVFPCSEAYYNGKLGDGLRENFFTYEKYLDACMVRTNELSHGIMQYKDGKSTADKLLNKKLLVRGVETDAYPGAVWANNYDCGVEGYGAGTFHWANMNEVSILMRDIIYDMLQPMDAINVSLGKRTGWIRIPISSNCWACSYYDISNSWSYYLIGTSFTHSFFTQLRISAVAHFTLDNDEPEYNSENVIKKYPSRGDIFIIKDGKKRFIAWQTATKEFVDQQQAVGVVYDVNGKNFDVVAGVNDKAFPWSVACDFEITSIPSESGDLEVKLQNKVVGTFSYVKTDGTKAEFVGQLNTWLADNAPKWEAYMENETTAILQMSTYDSYEDACAITGCKLVKRVGSELAAETISWNRNQVLQRTIYNGCCRARLGEWAATQTSSNSNPTTRMNGTTQLFVTFPCSEAYYNGELGDGLRENFATYEDYLDACMVRPVELREGIMRYKDGKPLADKLLNKKLLVRGVEKDAYPCAVWANNFDCGVEGYGAGTFHQAGMSEISILMRDITLGTKQPLDAVNTSLSKRTGWSQISSTSHRWAAGRCYTDGAWYFHSYGFCNSAYFYRRLAVSAVARFTLDDD